MVNALVATRTIDIVIKASFFVLFNTNRCWRRPSRLQSDKRERKKAMIQRDCCFNAGINKIRRLVKHWCARH